MNDLDFIKDDELRKTLEDSIEYTYALYEQSKAIKQKELYQEETYRVIILYVVSAIEAVLLYFYKEQEEKMAYIEYKCVWTLPDYESVKKPGLPVVIAVQINVEKEDHQIGLRELVGFFETKGFIPEKTANDILELNDVRNTFHFSKHRSKKCDVSRVNSAFALLLDTLERIPKTLK